MKNNLTIGFFTNSLHNSVTQRIWRGLSDVAREHGANLLSFTGEHITDTNPANVVYDLVNPDIVDGLVMYAGMLGQALHPEAKRQLWRRYLPMPTVLLEEVEPGFPCVTVDFRGNMRTVVTHLIAVHGYRRIAFIRGSETHTVAEMLYQGYQDALSAYDIPCDPTLVTPPTATFGFWSDGRDGIRLLFDERQVRPEAVVGMHDVIALGAMEALLTRGLRVPEDVAVAGHNNAGHNSGDETRWVRAPLTTIPNPAYEMGRQGAEAVLAKIAGAAVPDTIVIPAQLVVRQSCGCLNPAVVQAGTEVVMSADELPGAEAFTVHREAIVRAMVQAVGTTPYAGDQAGRLFDAFAANLNGPVQDAFLTALHQVLTTDGPIAVWQNALSELRRHVRPHLKTDALALQAETLWHQARVIIGEMAQRFQDFQALQTAHHAQALRELEQALISTFDVQELMDTLVEGLPRVGIAQCFLSLYEDPARPVEWARLMLAYDETGRVALEPIGRRFLSRRLVPDELWPLEKGFNLVAEALYFHEQQLGFILFKVDPREGVVYETLRGEISSALQGALLMQRVQHHAAEIDAKNTELRRHQNHLQERIAERTAEITQINACLRDEIVERKRVEQVLLVNEQQYRLLAENNKDGLVIVQANRIVFVNKALAAMFSTSVDRLLQSDPRALFSDGAQCLLTSDVETEAVGSPRQIELVTNTGRTIWTEIAQTTIVWNTQNALLLTIRNINQSKLRELRLEAERVRLRQENLLFKSAIVDRCRFGHLIGKSAIMQRVYDLIISAASSDANVLIAGESGTGKELIARTIHQVSWRKAHPFVPVNCASIPETLFEREFFGHRKGTFTGADRDTPGLFDKAHRGTLFLDEVSELTPATQAKLLRVLQDGQYTPLGSATPKQSDVLIVAATNKNCQEEIAHGRLREDFFYRIGVIELAVPPLRDRKDDLPVLIEHILEQYRQRQLKIHGKLPEDVPADHSMLPGEFVQMLYVYDWPGNVRELQNVLQRYLATRDLPTILSALGGMAHPRPIAQREQPAARLTLSEALKALERQMIAEAWERTYHHIGKTAESLGMPRRTLHNKLIKYQLR